jgi:hypothetical protein
MRIEASVLGIRKDRGKLPAYDTGATDARVIARSRAADSGQPP